MPEVGGFLEKLAGFVGVTGDAVSVHVTQAETVQAARVVLVRPALVPSGGGRQGFLDAETEFETTACQETGVCVASFGRLLEPLCREYFVFREVFQAKMTPAAVLRQNKALPACLDYRLHAI